MAFSGGGVSAKLVPGFPRTSTKLPSNTRGPFRTSTKLPSNKLPSNTRGPFRL